MCLLHFLIISDVLNVIYTEVNKKLLDYDFMTFGTFCLEIKLFHCATVQYTDAGPIKVGQLN